MTVATGADPGPKLSEAHASAKRELTGVWGRSHRKNFQDHALKIVGKRPNSITSLNYRATFSKGAAQGFCKQTSWRAKYGTCTPEISIGYSK